MGDALFHIHFIRKKVIHIEVKIPKEIRAHRETIFFGLSARQFICAVLAVGLAAGIYLGLGGIIGKEAASWLCLLVAAPVAIAGFLFATIFMFTIPMPTGFNILSYFGLA